MGKILYLVWSKVPDDVEKEWKHYIDTVHIPDLINTHYFTRAQRLKVIDGNEPGNYLVIYESPSKKDFDEYLKYQADGLRKDFINHFGKKITLTRVVLDQEFSKI